jgi:hypothetical protein
VELKVAEQALEAQPPLNTARVRTATGRVSGNLWQMAFRAGVKVALRLVELRGFEPLTPCMPCHPHPLTRPSAASPRTASAVLKKLAGRGAVVRREAACGIAADNLLTRSGLGHALP